MALIELKKVSKAFGPLVVLDGLDLAIESGQSLVVIGASGTGKSVLLKHIVGLLRPDEGEVWFDGVRVDEMPERDLMEIRTRFGFLFQLGETRCFCTSEVMSGSSENATMSASSPAATARLCSPEAP